MSEMGFNLDKLKEVVSEGELAAHPDLVNLLSTNSSSCLQKNTKKTEAEEVVKAASAVVAVAAQATDISQLGVTSTTQHVSASAASTASVAASKKSGSQSGSKSRAEKSLSCKEIERDRGKPLSKFDRNVMIFDWLHGLDELATIDLS